MLILGNHNKDSPEKLKKELYGPFLRSLFKATIIIDSLLFTTKSPGVPGWNTVSTLELPSGFKIRLCLGNPVP